MRLEIEHADGVREIELTRLPTQVDVLQYRAKEARWPAVPNMGLGPKPDPEAVNAWMLANPDGYAAFVERMAAAYPAQLEWLGRFLLPGDAQWIAEACTAAIVGELCAVLLATREVPAEAAKKLKLRPVP